jgi:hypothetical protein
MAAGRYQQAKLYQLSFVMADTRPGMTTVTKEKPRPQGRGLNSLSEGQSDQSR